MSLSKTIKAIKFALVILAGLLTISAIYANTSSSSLTSYKNVFISYNSPQDVTTLANLANDNQLGGYILWTIQGDTDPATAAGAPNSLLAALQKSANKNQDIMAYWTNWGIYTSERALPINSYPIPGSMDSSGKNQLTNQDLLDKLPYITTLTYAFLEVVSDGSDATGTIYFNDPWGDLTPTDSFCTNNLSCTYAVKPGKTFASSAQLGNFEAFAALPTKQPAAAHLNTTISIGGYSHDDAFEATFGSPAYMQNFANSAKNIIVKYNLSGIDLDYENPSMTNAQSQKYLDLITALDASLPIGKTITVTILAGPDYINGKNGVGFAPGILAKIAAIPHVKQINLMTYDFHGAFDYTGDNKGKTGFLSNIFMPNDTPDGYDAKFSIDTSVQALLTQGVPSNKIGVGIPAYGRALANVSSTNGGLFQTLTSQTIIPRGDLDANNCVQSVPLATNNACSGSFSYSYIIEHMLGSGGFTATEHTDNDTQRANGTTAFATTFNPAGKPSYSLTLINLGAAESNPGAWAGINLTVGSFASDYLANGGAGSQIVYTSPTIDSIMGATNLTVQWTTWNAQGYCPNIKFDFTQDTTIGVEVANDGSGRVVCEISQ